MSCAIEIETLKGKNLGIELGEKELNEYEIIERIGVGGFGSIFKIQKIKQSAPKLEKKKSISNLIKKESVSNLETNKSDFVLKPEFLALKVIDLKDKINKIKFNKEYEIYKKFSIIGKQVHCIHENINCHFSIFERQTIGGKNINCGFIVTALYDSDLRKIMNNTKEYNITIPEESNNINTLHYIKWIEELMSVITYIHNNKIGHGDIKPENILVKNDLLSLTDFDSVCFTDKCQVPAPSGPYASPKYYNNFNKTIDNFDVQVSDIWCLAMIILELWFGKNNLEKFINIDTSFATEWYAKTIKNSNLFDKIKMEIDNTTLHNNNFKNEGNKIYIYNLLSTSIQILEKINSEKYCTKQDITDYLNKLKNLIKEKHTSIHNVKRAVSAQHIKSKTNIPTKHHVKPIQRTKSTHIESIHHKETHHDKSIFSIIPHTKSTHHEQTIPTKSTHYEPATRAKAVHHAVSNSHIKPVHHESNKHFKPIEQTTGSNPDKHDYSQKYIKYKSKYIQLKNVSQY